mmetsp:Transcript_3155/g.9616  ORF Transcript_3155/g.9616 Transcript_3155/m.9616 type:complete len:275 (-) Transcript_3155:1509-2333(-)
MGDNIRGANDADSPMAVLMSIPPVARTLLVGSFGVTVLFMAKILPSTICILDWYAVLTKFRIWRIPFSLFNLGSLSMQTIFLYMVVLQQGKFLENGVFGGDTAAFLWCNFVIVCALLALDFVFNSYVLCESLIIAWLYLWSRNMPHQKVKMFFVITMKALYMPYAFAVITMLLSHMAIPVNAIKGIVAGHVVHFLMKIYPSLPGKSSIYDTPTWFRRLVDSASTGTNPGQRPMGIFSGEGGNNDFAGRSSAPVQTSARRRTGHSWGSGQRLGSQ